MKQRHSIIAAVLLAFATTAPGQDANPPAASAAEPQNEMKKWLADLDAQWRATFKHDVSDLFTAELDNLKIQYGASIRAAITKASDAGNLDGALALLPEQKRFSEANDVPAEDDAAVPFSVKQLRAGWRAQIAQMEKDRAARAKAVQAKYDQALAQAQTALTQRNRLDDALLVKARRDEIAAAWITPAVTAAAEKATPPPTAPAALVTNAQKPTPPPARVPFGTTPTPTRRFKATIPANSPDAFALGEVRKGTKISLKYVAGTWKSWGHLATGNPDDEKTEGADLCRMVIALPSQNGKGGEVLAMVPADTKKRRFVFEANSDYPGLVLRINGKDNAYSHNPGRVEYSVEIVPPAR